MPSTQPCPACTSGSSGSSDDDSTEDLLEDCNKCLGDADTRARLENERLNLNLGLPFDPTVLTRRNVSTSSALIRAIRRPIRLVLRLLDKFLALVETPLFQIWQNHAPLRLRQKVTFVLWRLYLPLHKTLIGRMTGLHKSCSLEYHALTTLMWGGRLFPITIKRIRMSLSQLHVAHPHDAYPFIPPCNRLTKPTNGAAHGIRGHLQDVYHEMDAKVTPTGFRRYTCEATKHEMIVTGKFIQHYARPSQKVIFWIYGGAFLAGDSAGNLGIAEKMGLLSGESGKSDGARDVFIPDYRLVPENHLDDALHDIALAYEYLLYVRGYKAENVVLFGISSGGGLATLLLQFLAKAQMSMPSGGVLVGPFVDYTEPTGTMKEYIRHDLIVNQSVYDEGIPYLETVLGSHEKRVEASPCYGDFAGLPPLCVCVSEHEVVYDQAILLAKRAKAQGCDVSVGCWKYMCHVFPMLCAFIPEGREAFNFMAKWIGEH